MVEPGRSAGVREAKKSSSSSSSTAAAAMVKKKLATSKKRPEKEEKAEKKQSRQCTEPESPSYRLALKSLFSCRNSHGHGQQHHARPRAQQDTGSRSKRLGCSAPSICKLKDDSDSRHQRMPVPPPEETMGTASAGEPCKRRASVSGSSERCVKKPLSEAKCGTGRSSSATAASSNSNSKQLQRGGSSLSSSSSSGGSSFRAGMQLRRLSGCYECHMVVDPVSGSTSMRATASTIFPCPDCGEVFVRQESLHLHQSIRHAVSELGADDTSRNIIEIIFQSSWLKKQSPVCKVDRILKVHNTPRTLARFEEYRDAVKARAAAGGGAGKQPVAIGANNNSSSTNRHPRCTADGNELLRFHCATLACSLGLNGATHLCDAAGTAGGCAACGIIRDGFSRSAGDGGVLTMATSGRAHDAVPVLVPAAEDGSGGLGEEAERQQRRAMLVCRVIAGRVKRPKEEEQVASVSVSEEEAAADADAEGEEEEYDSVAGSAGVYSNLEELLVFNPRAILPCFVVVYKA